MVPWRLRVSLDVTESTKVLLVQLYFGASDVARELQNWGLTVEISSKSLIVVKFQESQSVLGQLQRIASLPFVQWIEPRYSVRKLASDGTLSAFGTQGSM